MRCLPVRKLPSVTSRGRLLLLLQLITLLGLANGAAALDTGQAERLVEKWLATERQATVLQSDWQAQKPLLEQRIALLKAEREQLRAALKNHQLDEVEARRAELLQQQTAMEAEQAALRPQLKTLSAQLQGLTQLLPPPLLNAWNKEAAVADEQDISLQLQALLARLSRLAEFDQRINIHEMTLTEPAGKTVLVKQLYLGVGGAWFTSQDGSYAGTGRATPEGWRWHFDEALDSATVKRAIAIHQKQRAPEFVALPLRLYSGEDE